MLCCSQSKFTVTGRHKETILTRILENMVGLKHELVHYHISPAWLRLCVYLSPDGATITQGLSQMLSIDNVNKY